MLIFLKKSLNYITVSRVGNTHINQHHSNLEPVYICYRSGVGSTRVPGSELDPGSSQVLGSVLDPDPTWFRDPYMTRILPGSEIRTRPGYSPVPGSELYPGSSPVPGSVLDPGSSPVPGSVLDPVCREGFLLLPCNN
jgi:hypothetical protein